MSHDDDLYKVQRLIHPPKINASEPERVISVLSETKAEIEDVIAMAENHPKEFLRRYAASITLLRKVAEAAEVEVVKSWNKVGMSKTELSNITDRSRGALDRSLKKSQTKSDSFSKTVDEAQRKSRQVTASRKANSDPDKVAARLPDREQRGKSAPLKKPSVGSPYDDSDYDQI